MACPSRLARKIICFPSVSFAPISSSLASRLMAMIPLERGFENSESVAERRKFIEDNALDVVNLDI